MQVSLQAKKDHWAEAFPLFQKAWELKRSYDIAGNLGIAEASLGRFRDAAEHLSFALRSFPANGKNEHKKLLELTFAKALQQVAAVTVKASLDKTDVALDGKAVGMAPLEGPLFVEAGAHTIEGRRAGYVTASQGVEATKGGTFEVTLAMREELPAAPPPPPVPVQKRSVVPGAVLGGVAGAALVAGVAVFAVGRSTAATTGMRDAILKGGVGCVPGVAVQDPQCEDLRSAVSSHNAMERAGVGLMIGAGAAAVASGIYFLMPRFKSSASIDHHVRVVPVVSPAAAGLIFSGAF